MIPTRPNDLTHPEIRRMVQRRDPIILEIGANDGEDTQAFLASFPFCFVHCFECDPRAIAKWKNRVKDHRARLYEFALDDHEGEATFYQSSGSPFPHVKDWDKSGSLNVPTGHLSDSPWCKFDTTITVPTKRLDDWAKTVELPRVDFMWIDVQGAERRVFAGGLETLAKTRFVKVECHPREMYAGQFTQNELIEFFKGWACLGRFANDLLFVNRGIR